MKFKSFTIKSEYVWLMYLDENGTLGGIKAPKELADYNLATLIGKEVVGCSSLAEFIKHYGLVKKASRPVFNW